MRRYRMLVFAGGMAALVLALAAAGLTAVKGLAAGPGGAAAPLAVVLVPGSGRSELVVVDLDAARIVRRVALRSLVTDIDVDVSRGTIVGAQTGGIGTAADDAVSLTDVRSGVVRYVTLPTVDPSQVRCLAGRAVVLHSVVDAAGYRVSSVDLRGAGPVTSGHAPDGPGLWAAAGGSLWSSVPSKGPERYVPVRLDPATLAVSGVGRIGFAPTGVVAAGDAVALLGTGPGRPGGTGGRVALVDAKRGAVTATATVAGLPHGAQIGVAVADSLVIGDWNGDLPESSSLAVIDGATLAARRTLRVGGAPCALAAHGDRVLVVDRSGGTLSELDPVTGAVAWTVDLGVRDLVCSKIVVLGGGTRGARPGATGDPRVADAR